MVKFKILRFLTFLSALVISNSLLFAEVILSSAYGLVALNRISSDAELRRKISITEEQLSEIRKILSNKKLFSGDVAFNEAVGKSYLSKTLSKDQANQLRIETVKTSIGSPTNLFSSALLMEFGLSNDEAARIQAAFFHEHAKIAKNADKLRSEAIKESFPPEVQATIWKWIGKEFSVDENGGDLKQIKSVMGLTLETQFTVGSIEYLSYKVNLSVAQRERLRAVIHEKIWGRTVFPDEELESELDDILTQSQRYALIQVLHQLCLRSDLMILVAPGLTKHFDISNDAIDEAKNKLLEAKKVIQETEIAQTILAASEILKRDDVPSQVKTGIKELVAGVWSL